MSSDYSIHFQNLRRNLKMGQRVSSSQISPIPQFQQSSPLNSVLVNSQYQRPQANLTQRQGEITPKSHSARSATPVMNSLHKYYKLAGEKERSQSSCSRQPSRQHIPSQILEPQCMLEKKLESSPPPHEQPLSFEQKYRQSMLRDLNENQQVSKTVNKLKHSKQNQQQLINIKHQQLSSVPFSTLQRGIQNQDQKLTFPTMTTHQHQQKIQVNQQMKSLQIENAALRQDLQNVMITLQRNQNAMQIRQLQQQQMIKQMNTKNRLLSLIQLIKSLIPFTESKDQSESAFKNQQFNQLRGVLGIGSSGHSVNLSSNSLASIITKNQNLCNDQFYLGSGYGTSEKKSDIMSKSINDIIYDLQKILESFLNSLESKQKMRQELQSKMIHNLKNINIKEVLKLKQQHADQVSILVQKVREEEKLIVQDELSQLITQNHRLTQATISDNQKDTADMFLLRIDNDNLRAQLNNQQKEYQQAINILNKNAQEAKLSFQSNFQQKLLLTQSESQAKHKNEYQEKLQNQKQIYETEINQLKSITTKLQEQISLYQKQISQGQQQKLRYADEKIKQKLKQQENQQQFTKKMHKQQIQEIKKVHDRINSELQLKLIQAEKQSSLKIEQARIDTRMQQEKSRLDLVQQLQSLKRSQMKYLQNNNKLTSKKLFGQVERMQKLIQQVASNFFNKDNTDALMSREFFESDVQKIRNGLNNLSAKVHNQYSKQGTCIQVEETLREDIHGVDDESYIYASRKDQQDQILSTQMQNIQQLCMKRGRSKEKIQNKYKGMSVKSESRERSNSIFKIQAQGKFTNNDSIVSKPPISQAIMIQNTNAVNQSLLSYNPLLSTKSNNNNSEELISANKKNFSKTFPHQNPTLSNTKSNQSKLQPIAQNILLNSSNYRRNSRLEELKKKKCLRCGMQTDQLKDKSFPQIKCKFHPFRLKKGVNKFLYTAQWNYCKDNCANDSQQGCLQIHNHLYQDDEGIKQNRAPIIRSQTPQKIQAKSLNYQQQKKFSVDPLKQSLVITQKQDRNKKGSPHQDITLATNDDSISNFSDIRHHSRPFNAMQERQPKFKTDVRGRSVRSSIQSHKGKIKQQLKSVQRRIQQLNQSSVVVENPSLQQQKYALYKSTNSNLSNFARLNISKEAADVLSPREFIVSPRENQNGLASQRSKKSMTFAGEQMSNRLNENESLS